MLLLKFPYLIQVEIIKNLELHEYFFLGLCSKKSRKMLRNSGVVKYDNAVIHTVYSTLQVQKFACHGRNVVMYSAKNDRENMHLRHGIPFWSGQIRLWYRDNMILCRISTHPTLQIPILWCRSKHKALLPMALHSYICKIFHLFTEVQILFRFSRLSDFPDTLEVDNLHEWASSPVENSKSFFEKINIRNGLSLSEDKFLLNTEHRHWSVEHLSMGLCSKITADHLCAFRGSTAFFEVVDRIFNQDLVKFIDNWLNSDNRKLEAMMVKRCVSTTIFFDKDTVLGHFDLKPWDPKRRAGRFLYPDGWRVLDEDDPADCTIGMDIERKSDGMLATVIITPRLFKFFVWHQRFPDPEKNKPMVKPPVAREQLKWMMVGSLFF